MNWLEFLSNFLSNALATFLGLVIGIFITFWIERKLENRRRNETKEQNNKKAEELLARVLGQIFNADSRLKYFRSIEQRPYLIFLSFYEVEVIESLHRELTVLDANRDVLQSLDFVISSLKSLNGLLSVNREIFALTFEKNNSTRRPYFEKFDSDLDFQFTLVSENIKEFRKLAFGKYKNLQKQNSKGI
jgi:hypothetical protein